MEAKLVVVGGKAKAEQFSLTLPTIVGRSRSADLPLNHPLVSRQHCELFESGGQLMVRDLGSLNGTFVGDSRVTDEVVIEPGGHLTVGSVTFEAVYDAPPATEGDQDPDFEMADDDDAEIDQTIDVSSGKRGGAKPQPAAPQDEGFDMGWLDDGSEEDSELEEQDGAPDAQADDSSAEQAAAGQAELTGSLAPADEIEEKTIDHRAAAPGRAASGRAAPGSAASRSADGAKPAAAPRKALSRDKPPAKTVQAADDELVEFAPTEGKGAEGEGGEDLDDFFRSLSEP